MHAFRFDLRDLPVVAVLLRQHGVVVRRDRKLEALEFPQDQIGVVFQGTAGPRTVEVYRTIAPDLGAGTEDCGNWIRLRFQ